MSEFWEVRAKDYQKLDWPKDKSAIDTLIKFAEIEPWHCILDAGCGTGEVTYKLSTLVNKPVYGIDSSAEMLANAKLGYNVSYILMDVRENLTFYYDKIICRMLLHHMDNFSKLFSHFYRNLARDGELIVEELGVISNKTVYNWFKNMMRLKEKRTCFTHQQLIDYFSKAGFKDIRTLEIRRKMSIKNWLANSGLPNEVQEEIYNLHLNAPESVKNFYNMNINNGDIIIESPTLLIKGKKK